MDEKVFDNVAGDTLEHLDNALAEVDQAVDVSLSMGVLTITFDNGSRFIVNSHRAARQIWMAAHADAWHFDWNGSEWRSTKSNEELWSLVERKVGQELGRTVQLIRG